MGKLMLLLAVSVMAYAFTSFYKKSIKDSMTYTKDTKFRFEMATAKDYENASMNQTVGFVMEKDDAKKVDGTIYLNIDEAWKPIKNLKGLSTKKANFNYLGKNNAINKYLIAAHIPNKIIKWYLIDKKTGNATMLGSEPVFSTNQSIFATLKHIPDFENRKNSIHIWKVNKTTNASTVNKHITSKNTNWIPLEMQWETETSIIIKTILRKNDAHLNSNLTNNHFSFIRMVITP
ncbi:hypothetical protein ACFSKN_06575 [Mariniflexile gromovii]